MLTAEEIKKRVFELPDECHVHYINKRFSQAKACYDKAITIAVFCQMDEKDRDKLFGNRMDESNIIEGLFNEKEVSKSYLWCIRNNQTYEKKEFKSAKK